MQEKVLITGCAGFIGSHLTRRLLSAGYAVVGLDNMNSYYDVALKEARLAQIKQHPMAETFTFIKGNLEDEALINRVFAENGFSVVVNLAAQAGVRYSIENPRAYISANIVGFMNILEACRHSNVKHLLYASSSSVYGSNANVPFSVHQNVDHPISLYAATKKSNELMAHTYSHLYNLSTTGLRFFTVYGPWGRPDMALYMFTKNIIEGKPIRVFNSGKMMRDFTYIDDIVEGITRLMKKLPASDLQWNPQNPDPGTSNAPYRVYNIGNNNPVELNHFINVLETCLGRKALRVNEPLQPGDVPATYADIDALIEAVDFRPRTSIEDGIGKFVEWYYDYYKMKNDCS